MTKNNQYLESLVGTGTHELPDYDGDGVPDILDCQPFNPEKDGIFGDLYRKATSYARRIRRTATKTVSRARKTRARATSRARRTVRRTARRIGAARAAAVRRSVTRQAKVRPAPAAAYKKIEKGVSKRLPSLEQVGELGAKHGREYPVLRRASQALGRKVMRLPEPVKKVSVEVYKFTRGSYKEWHAKPVTTVAKAALFAVASPVIKGVGVAAKAGRVAIAARAPVVAKIPVVGKAMVSVGRKAAPVGEKAAKYAIPAMGALWGASMAQRVYATPAERRAEEAGKIFAGEVVPMAAAWPLVMGARAVTPKMVKTPEYTGVYLRGIKKPIDIGGVARAEAVPDEGISQISKQLYVGGRRMPVGYEKMVSQKTVADAGKTHLAMESEFKATVGQLKYTHEKFARGTIEGEYFLPPARAVPKHKLIGKESSGDEIAEMLALPSPVPKPTRLYGKVSQTYMRGREMELMGGRPFKFIEAGKRQLEYGVPKPSVAEYELPYTEAPIVPEHIAIPQYTGFRPSSPPGVSTVEAEATFGIGAPPTPKLIAERMYFQKTPITSRHQVADDFLAMKPEPVREPYVGVKEPIIEPMPRTKPPTYKERPAEEVPYAEPMPQREPSIKREPLPFAEPEPAGFEAPWGEPRLQPTPNISPKRAPAPFAEPTKFEVPWTAPRPTPAPSPARKPVRVVEAKPARKPAPEPYTFRTPAPVMEPVIIPRAAETPYVSPDRIPGQIIYPSGEPIPSHAPRPTPRRRTYPVPDVYVYPSPEPIPAPAPQPSPEPIPAPAPARVPKPVRPAPIPWAPRPIVPPVVPVPHVLPPVWPGDGGMEGYAAPAPRRKRAWGQKEKLITLESFMGTIR